MAAKYNDNNSVGAKIARSASVELEQETQHRIAELAANKMFVEAIDQRILEFFEE